MHENLKGNGNGMPQRGRPKKHIDLELVEKLAHIQCTYNEIASTLGVSVDTLQRNADFAVTYKRGAEGGRKSLRRMQFESANRGNVAMQIWLGKQYLNQSDHRTEVQLRPEDMDPKQLVVVFQAMHREQQLEFMEAYREEISHCLSELRPVTSDSVPTAKAVVDATFSESAASDK